MTEQPVFSSFLLHRPGAEDGDSLKTLVDGDLMKESGFRQLQPYLDKSVARCTLVRETMCVPEWHPTTPTQLPTPGGGHRVVGTRSRPWRMEI